jgi:hypothetical protein
MSASAQVALYFIKVVLRTEVLLNTFLQNKSTFGYNTQGAVVIVLAQTSCSLSVFQLIHFTNTFPKY